MKKVFLSILVCLSATTTFAQSRSVGEHVKFAITNQLSTFKLERWVGSNDKIELSTCVAIGEFKQQTDKIYELAQVAYLTGEMNESVRAKADDLSSTAMSLLPFCGVNAAQTPKATYIEIVSKAKAQISILQDLVK